MMERGWLGEKRGQGFYKRVGKGAERRSTRIDWKTLEYHPAQKAQFPVGGSGAQHRGPAGAPAHAGGGGRSRRHVPVEAVQRPVALRGADGAGDLRPHRRDRSRHALGLRHHSSGRSSCGTRSAFRRRSERMRARGLRDSGECRADAGSGRADRSTRRPIATATRARATSISNAGAYRDARAAARRDGAGRYQARARRGEEECRRVAGRPGRRRALPGVPQQDERARRRHGRR